jgi:hypothetical protein
VIDVLAPQPRNPPGTPSPEYRLYCAGFTAVCTVNIGAVQHWRTRLDGLPVVFYRVGPGTVGIALHQAWAPAYAAGGQPDGEGSRVAVLYRLAAAGRRFSVQRANTLCTLGGWPALLAAIDAVPEP